MYKSSGLTKSYLGSGAIAANSIVKFGAADDTMSPAAAATDLLVGISNELGLSADDVSKGNMVDIVLEEIAELKLGGTVTRGQKLTSDASGYGVAAAPVAGSNVHIIAIALRSGVAGDIIPVLIEQSVFQG